MATDTQDPRQALVKSIIEIGNRAFDPASEAAESHVAKDEFRALIDSTSSWVLLPALNALIKPNAAPQYLKPEIMRILTRVPLRADGVRGTMEFIFSVHPSSISKQSEAAAPQKSGANITQEALAVATRIVTTPPTSVAPEVWFSGIAPQLFHLVDGNEGLELAKAASQMIMFGVLGKKQFGAPGSPGWNAFVEPIIRLFDPSRRPQGVSGEDNAVGSGSEIIDLTQDRILVTSTELARALRRLSTMLNSTPYPAQTRRILDPILPSMWSIASWSSPGRRCNQEYCAPAQSLLRTFFKIASNPARLLNVVQNLLYAGAVQGGIYAWVFQTSPDDGVHIVHPAGPTQARLAELNWDQIQLKSEALVDLLAYSCTADEISAFFLDLLGRWLTTTAESAKIENEIRVRAAEEANNSEKQLRDLCEVAVLHRMLERIPDKLISRVEQVLELVCRILDPDGLQDQADDIIAVSLSLLNLIFTSPTFKKSNLKPRGLEVIETSLGSLSTAGRPEVSLTAKNLLMLLQYREAADEIEGNDSFAPTERQIEDRNQYRLALSYITQPENPPPVRSEGLNLISGLVVSNSPALDVQAVLVLLSSLLQDSEDFINLRVIRVFTQIAHRHPKATTKEILDHYLDAKEVSDTDTRLRFGEALAQVIERLGETFLDDVAAQVTETLLSIAGRRGRRPKTEAKQARQARIDEMKQKQAEDAWGGDVPDLSDELKEEEEVRNQILAQIVEGWESKRGTEDVRMRSSALSILAVGIETNITGIGSNLVSASVDLCINVLTLEPEPEKGILRRAAILLILSFVKALDNARQAGRRLGFGLTDQSREDIMRVLKYVAIADNDGLVQQHARDVIESLENWQMTAFLPTHAQDGTDLGNPAGVRLPQGFSGSRGGQRLDGRPRIEEVE